MRDWCASRGISTAKLCAWRRAYTKGGEDFETEVLARVFMPIDFGL